MKLTITDAGRARRWCLDVKDGEEVSLDDVMAERALVEAWAAKKKVK